MYIKGVDNGVTPFREFSKRYNEYNHRRQVNWLLKLEKPLPLDSIVEGAFTMRTLYPINASRIRMEAVSRLIGGPGDAEVSAPGVPQAFVLVIDESHVSVPQIGGMYEGDASRKRTLVDFGFRLPSATDNRPLRFEEFVDRIGQTVYLSATPGSYELQQVHDDVVEQVIRPTGLIDPPVHIRPVRTQVDDLVGEVRATAAKGYRSLVTVLTKRMAEDLTEYLHEQGLRVRYMHSDIDTIERIEIIRDLRLGAFDALVGINLLREGLDIPECALVAILDADKEGFLRSETSLV